MKAPTALASAAIGLMREGWHDQHIFDHLMPEVMGRYRETAEKINAASAEKEQEWIDSLGPYEWVDSLRQHRQ